MASDVGRVAGWVCAGTRRASVEMRVMTAICVLAFAFDFKGSPGGSPIQYAMATANAFAFLLLAFVHRVSIPRRGFSAWVFWGWMVFLSVGSVGAIFNSVPFGHYIRTIYPFSLFSEGFLVAWWASGDHRSSTTLVTAMTMTALVSFFFTFWWGFHFTGEGAGAIRYQILSPLIPFLIVVAGYDLLFARRMRLWASIILALTLSVVALSVTRGMLLVVGMVGGTVCAAWAWNALRSSVSVPRPMVRVLWLGSATATSGLVAALILAPDVIDRWVHRGLGPARGSTFWTRVSAVVSQWDQLAAHPASWLTGLGFGHSYYFAAAFEQALRPYISAEAFATPKWYPGEFMWVTPLYYAGFIAGAVAIAILLLGVIRVFRTMAVLLRTRTWRDPNLRPIWVGVLGYLGFIGMGFTANPFMLRLSALFLGLCLGLAAAHRRTFVHTGHADREVARPGEESTRERHTERREDTVERACRGG